MVYLNAVLSQFLSLNKIRETITCSELNRGWPGLALLPHNRRPITGSKPIAGKDTIIPVKLMVTLYLLFGTLPAFTQNKPDTTDKKYSLHAQFTTVPQYHFDFKAPYTGDNSLLPHEPPQTSFTSTLFFAYQPFRHTYFVFNPEATAGKGLSKTLGLAGFSNGEIYRVGDPSPHLFIARLYAEQQFPLSGRKEKTDEDLNQVKETKNADYLSVIAGKFSISDFFDVSAICNDPRTQFLNWALMGSAAWDYPANTRGYTMGTVVQFVYHNYAVRGALTTVPTEANGPNLQFRWNKAMGSVFEFKKNKLFYRNDKVFSDFTFGFYHNIADMGNYAQALKNALPIFKTPDVTTTRQYGRTKTGWYVGMDNHFSKIHYYINYSRDDGKNETWAFTEIDRSFATGLHFDGDLWKRANDHIGVAFVVNGLSNDHEKYLAAGGYGFIIGDGKLNYGHEQITEVYYSLGLTKYLFISPDYQFVKNPAYNKDRGPVHIVSVRLHVEL
jgi:high affinity Mn2+ porin